MNGGVDVLGIFEQEKASVHGFVRVAAPMVRYSKLEFRKLVRQNGAVLCFTPMIIADSFIKSETARQNEFTTSVCDTPLIAQFAAKDAAEFVKAAELISPYVSGIDLNCGCPQSWAIAEGYGCGLLRHPELVRDIVQSVRRLMPTNFSISVKMRLLEGNSTESTVELARQLEHCGATFLTLHGRTPNQKRAESALNVPAMAEVKQSVHLPIIVNGSVRSWQDACGMYEQTGADGVMAARGLLSNPALFNPVHADVEDGTPIDCVQQWLDIANEAGSRISFPCFHHHLIFMWSNHMPKQLRLVFNTLRSKESVLDFLEEHYNLRPKSTTDTAKYTKTSYGHIQSSTDSTSEVTQDKGWQEDSEGKYFKGFRQKLDADEDFELADSFFNNLN